MRTFTFAIALVCMHTGCGPLMLPAVDRLEPEGQRYIDEGWSRALQRADYLDRQGLLDVLVAARLHVVGVDRLHLRSEKEYRDGVIAMTVQFDRTRPDDDLFAVTIYNHDMKIVRHERYTHDEVRETYQALFSEPANPDDPGWVSRMDKVREIFPDENAKESPAEHGARWNAP